MKKVSIDCKSNELSAILHKNFEGKINLARVKLISMFVIALCKVQTVTFERLAIASDSSAKTSSSKKARQNKFWANLI
ncbi:MAG: hypothetical protein CSA05_03265 [Bacteroidia bacterium]|nr:MAG: hypothetical protein CSA05_03265 [Bacteroidia bacterium]